MTVLGMLTLVGSVRGAIGGRAFLPPSERLSALGSIFRWACLPVAWCSKNTSFVVPHIMGSITTAVAHSSASRKGFGGLVFVDRQTLPNQSEGSLANLFGLLPILGAAAVITLAALPLMLWFTLGSFVPGSMAFASRLLSSYSYSGDPESEVKLYTTGVGASGARVHSTFVCPGDAGIWCTAKLACETALFMLASKEPLPAGFITPGDMAEPLIGHLNRHGVQLSAVTEQKI
uniref:Saccharopine dehydrogenase-like C-terminal domain-containing protein n=1 Tax=Coccolithus braarudii TaxID=221442 RepID=A0A7S0Q2P8_9EUKA